MIELVVMLFSKIETATLSCGVGFGEKDTVWNADIAKILIVIHHGEPGIIVALKKDI